MALAYGVEDANPKIEAVQDVHRLVFESAQLNRSENQVLLLDRNCQLIGAAPQRCRPGSGLVKPKHFFAPAVRKLASRIVTVRRQSAGSLEPGRREVEGVRRLVEAGRVLDIALLDHVLISDEEYYSFRLEGKLDS